MVSTAMQGGCTCENSSCLRVETGNIEFAALFAPKPQGMTAADDWTKEMATKGFPELKEHYELLGAPKNVMLLQPHRTSATTTTIEPPGVVWLAQQALQARLAGTDRGTAV